MSEETVQEKLGRALRQRDDETRSGRAERIIWLSAHLPESAAYMGRAEPLHLMEEVRAVFVSGQFAATLVLALAVIEHCLVEELQLQNLVRGRPGLSNALKQAAAANIIPNEWPEILGVLSARRNAFVHFKFEENNHGLSSRVRAERTHPRTLLEADAKESLAYMYKVFRATLHEAA